MKNVSTKWVEGVLLAVTAVLLILFVVAPFDYAVANIPVAVNGLTTISGILVAFIGFSLNHSYSSHENYQFKRWFKKRVTLITLPIIFGLFLIAFSYSYLVRDQLVLSFKLATGGLFTIILAVIESFVVMFANETDYVIDV